MTPTPAPPLSPSPAFLERFHTRAGASGRLRFDLFMDLALYDPFVGYYCRDRGRVGYERGTDFFTASTSGPLFGELVCAAAASLMNGKNLADYTFVEIGAEPSHTILDGVRHPFAAMRTLPLGSLLTLSGKCVVFSNELFDAQPFRRFVRQTAAWKEKFVTAKGPEFAEIVIEIDSADRPAELPEPAPEGYQLDLPFAARTLANQLAGQTWTGLFVAFDYGKSWREIVEATPQGTARAYYRHTQSNDLLARPGDQDLTCHVCWDWLADVLSRHRFQEPTIESQEAFFVRHAGKFIAETSAAEASRFSQRKLSLMQLLHPAHLGQKFQALHAVRD